MNCENCGFRLVRADNYCAECGAQVRDDCYYCRESMNDMDFSAYQEKSKETAQGFADPFVSEMVEGSMSEKGEHALFLATAINGEAGELAEKVKKYVREEDEEYLEDAVYELGDILWYMAQMATLLDVDLSDVAEDNLDKLLDRKERDAITGEGDHR